MRDDEAIDEEAGSLAAADEPAAAPAAAGGGAPSAEPAADAATFDDPSDICLCSERQPYPVWSCHVCGKLDPDWRARREGLSCHGCGSTVAPIFHDCQVCGRAAHAYPLDSAECRANADFACHGGLPR